MKHSTKILLIVVALLAIGGGVYYAMQRGGGTTNILSKVAGDYATYTSPIGFDVQYPKTWNAVTIKDPTEDHYLLGSVNFFPNDGLVDGTLSDGPYGLIIKNIKTQAFSILVQTSKPGLKMTKEELKKELLKETEDILDEELAFSQPGKDPAIVSSSETDSSAYITYKYTYNETPFNGALRSIMQYNEKNDTYSLVILHYRAKAEIYNQTLADMLLNSIMFK